MLVSCISAPCGWWFTSQNTLELDLIYYLCHRGACVSSRATDLGDIWSLSVKMHVVLFFYIGD